MADRVDVLEIPKTPGDWNSALKDENKEQLEAYRTFRDLGASRSYNRLMQVLPHPRARGTYQYWRRKFFWDERVRLHVEGYGEPKAGEIAVIPTDTPGSLADVSNNLENIMDAVLQTLDNVFVLKKDGSRVPKFDVGDVKEFQILVRTLAELVKIQLEIHYAKEREDNETKSNALAKAVNKLVGTLTTAQLIDAIKGGEVIADLGERLAGNVEEADYTEVSGDGVKDG